jgi:hypothetical protein
MTKGMLRRQRRLLSWAGVKQEDRVNLVLLHDECVSDTGLDEKCMPLFRCAVIRGHGTALVPSVFSGGRHHERLVLSSVRTTEARSRSGRNQVTLASAALLRGRPCNLDWPYYRHWTPGHP